MSEQVDLNAAKAAVAHAQTQIKVKAVYMGSDELARIGVNGVTGFDIAAQPDPVTGKSFQVHVHYKNKRRIFIVSPLLFSYEIEEPTGLVVAQTSLPGAQQ